MSRKPSRFWCQACGAYAANACHVVGHRSERMQLDTGGRWRRHSPPIVLERNVDGRLIEVKP